MPDDHKSKEVVGLGLGTEESSELYAELTGRASGGVYRQLADINPSTTAVLVTTTNHVSNELMETLYCSNGRTKSVPGLIFARDSEQLTSRVRSIAAKVCEKPTGPNIELYPTWQIDDQWAGERHLLGALASREAIRTVLTSNSAMLTLMTHSNGFDALLGEGLAMCDAVAEKGRSLTGGPCCHFTGECHRLRVPVHDAVDSGGIVLPDQIRARIFFFCTCLGVMFDKETIDSAWGFTDGLLGGNIAATITSWTVLLPDLEYLELALRKLYSGMTVGQSVAELNSRGTGITLAVLGDPDVRIDALSQESLDQLQFHTPDEQVPGDGGRFLCALTYAASLSTTDTHQQLAAAAAEELQFYEHAVGLGITARQSYIGATMRKAVMDFLGSWGVLISGFWTPSAFRRSRSACVCDACGKSADLFQFEFRQTSIPPRELLICQLCGIRRDAPAASQLSVTRCGRSLTLHGPLPEEDWSAIVHFDCQDRTLSCFVEWPRSGVGAPVRTFELPSPWPPGPLIIGVILVAGAELTIVTTTGPGDTPDRTP